MSAMYTATFTFAKGEFDAAFFALDAEIAQLAKSIPGYLGEEAWENPSTGLMANVYYWASLEALQTLISHPAHIAAKQRQAQWLLRPFCRSPPGRPLPRRSGRRS